MSRLKLLFEEMGFAAVETFIASGNVIFQSEEPEIHQLEDRIARHLESSLGYAVDTFVRTAAEVIQIGAATVFPEDGQPGAIVQIAFLHQKLDADRAKRMEAIRTGNDEFRVIGREFYWLRRTREVEWDVWALPEVKSLRLPTSTMRNMSSIRKLIAKHLAED